jgi:hypothetical protein
MALSLSNGRSSAEMSSKRFLRTCVLLLVLLLAPPALGAADSLAAIRGLAEKGQAREALKEIDSYLKTRPRDFDGRLLKGSLLAQAGDSRQAALIFDQLIAEHPEKPEPYNNRAVLYAEAGRYEEAAETLKRALATHPSYSVAYENLGRVYGRSASEAYSRALGVEPPAKSGGERLVLLRETAPVPGATPPVLASLQPATPRTSDPLPSRPAPPAQVPVTRAPQPQPVTPRPAPSQPATSQPATSQPATSQPATSQRPGPEAVKPQPVKAPATATPAAGRQEAPAAGRQEAPAAERQEPATPERQEPAPVAPPAADGEIVALVKAWAQAWSQQQPDEYLSFYAADFRVPDGLTRQQWEAQRRDRLTRPQSIRVVIRNLLPPVTTADGTEVRFVQAYSSDRYADKVSKTLLLRRVGGAWKILDERTDP